MRSTFIFNFTSQSTQKRVLTTDFSLVLTPQPSHYAICTCSSLPQQCKVSCQKILIRKFAHMHLMSPLTTASNGSQQSSQTTRAANRHFRLSSCPGPTCDCCPATVPPGPSTKAIHSCRRFLNCSAEAPLYADSRVQNSRSGAQID